MNTKTSGHIRQQFLDFFASKGHKIEPSASLIPVDDPTLLWINSGVATLKKYFDGTETPSNPRITNAQKSIRTNDIENVGHTARHHTLFEMLGNFSIGDYFKEEVIPWAWEFLTSSEWLGLDPERLYVTYYPEDTDTKRIWHEVVGLPESHIVPVADNFWDIGAGPCGPCSEIFYDRGEAYQQLAADDPENYPGGENERYLEIWNLVFSEFNHLLDDTYKPLPRKNIDTGMGLERVVSVIQDTPTNFETDLFRPIIARLEALSGKRYNEQAAWDISFKVIADHIRAVSFAIGDGALPSNEGRGYILRRLIRRSVMHGQKLGISGTFLTQLVEIVGTIMESYYPEVLEKADFIKKVIGSEEAKFQETIHDGVAILTEYFDALALQNSTVLSGEAAFKLYDTYGFPLELTMEYAAEKGVTVDEAAFEDAMEAQRTRAREARQTESSMGVQTAVYSSIEVPSLFIGYQFLSASSELLAAVVDEQATEHIVAGSEAMLFFAQTPFYAEMGGQIADTGVILDADGTEVAQVTTVKKAPNGQPMHVATVVRDMDVNRLYMLQVDADRRQAITRNHTATHLLHRALKDVLGEHANQAGSYVAPDYLRFDFTHFGQVSAAELQQMERIVNEKIWQAIPVTTIKTTQAVAKEMGAMALFGEKYGDIVRVVDIGGYSIELCGGVHVAQTSDIGVFKIVSEGGIGAGVRRIEAVTSQQAYEQLHAQEQQLVQSAQLLKVPQVAGVVPRLEQILHENRQLTQQLDALKGKLLAQESASLLDHVTTINGVRLTAVATPNKEMAELRTLADSWKQKDNSDVLVLASVIGDKVSLLVAANQTAQNAGIQAGSLIKGIAPLVGGGGGGRADMAQAGGRNPEGVPAALQAAADWIAKQ